MSDMHGSKGFALTAGVAVVAMIMLGAADRPEEIQLGDVLFPHELHVEDLEIECVECHHETNASGLETPHPEYFSDFWIRCSTCHHDETTAAESHTCSSCHPRHPRSFADETLSAKVVVHKSCWSCHEVATGADASSGCVDCHQGGGRDGAS
jgi:hypothetical protein